MVFVFSALAPHLLKQDLSFSNENIKKSVGQKEYRSLDKMTGEEICFSEGTVWREHKSLLPACRFSAGLVPRACFSLVSDSPDLLYV